MKKAKTNAGGDPQSRLSLTLLFCALFSVLLLSMLLAVGTIALILVNTGALGSGELGLVNGNLLILIILGGSAVLGMTSAFFFGRFFMTPIKAMIDMMNRLSAGDFHSRITFRGILAKQKTVAKLTDSINRTAEELERTEMFRTDFVNNFSHEFKTPIVSIAGFAGLLKDGNLSEEEKREYIGIIEEESLRLSAMATNVLNLTKVENQTILSDTSTYNLSEQIRTCFLLLESKWDKKRVDFHLDFDEYTVTANEELLKQVWLNLLDNAVKFTDEGGRICVRIEKETGGLAVSVTNTGSTVRPEDREKIFRKFYQADTSHATDGNGIGLAVVKRIVDLHGGTVTVDSADNETTFTVQLPL